MTVKLKSNLYVRPLNIFWQCVCVCEKHWIMQPLDALVFRDRENEHGFVKTMPHKLQKLFVFRKTSPVQ